MRVLVTGAAGFIGQHLVHALLERNHEVVAMIRPNTPSPWTGAERLSVMKCDLTDSHAVDLGNRGVEVVVHAAAAMRGTLDEQLAGTVTGTANLLQAAREAGIRRIVGLSSLAVLDFRSMRAMTLIDEHVPVARAADTGVYSQAKILQEALFTQFGAEADHMSLILRPGLVYDDRRLISAHAGIVRRGFSNFGVSSRLRADHRSPWRREGCGRISRRIV